MLVFLLLASACMFAFAMQAVAWWHIDQANVGPISTDMCAASVCKRSSLAWLRGSETWMRTGVATYSGGLLASILAALTAAAIAANRAPRLLSKMLLVSTVTAAISAVYFYAAFPSVTYAPVTRGFGAPLFAAAVMITCLAIAWLWKQIAAHNTASMHAASQTN